MAFVGNTNYNYADDRDRVQGSRPYRSSSRSFFRGQQEYEEEEAPFESQAEREARVNALARTLSASRQSQDQGRIRDADEMTLVDSDDPALDPHGDKFNAKKWMKHVMHQVSKRDGASTIRKGGVAWRNLTAVGEASDNTYQLTVGNAIPSYISSLFGKVRGNHATVDILKSMDGYLEAHELLVVLGPPGSGCSTFLKSLSGETHGFDISKDSYLNYTGIDAKEMHKTFRGESIYCAEVERNFPNLTVGGSSSK